MRKYIIIIISFFMLASCYNLNIAEKNAVKNSFIKEKVFFLNELKKTGDRNLKKFVISGIRNNIILNEIEKYDTRNFLVLIPNKTIKVKYYNKVQSVMVLNSGLSTYYFDVVWQKREGIWKIYSIYEK